jgi:glycosyltransferase involved in cell wall biosynthesis
MKLSVVTISFNQANFLERAIVSVVNQPGVPIEYIVVDPGSTDGSRQIIERYRDSLSHIIFERDTGPADGLNKGFERATGDVFGYINADDFYLPGGLSKAFSVLQSWPEVSAIVGNGFIVDEHGRIKKRALSTRFSLSGFARGHCFAFQQATFVRAEPFRAVGGFNTANSTFWDAELLVDIARKGGIIRRYDEYVGAFRIHSGSITGSSRLHERYLEERRRIFDFEKLMGRPETGLDRLLRPMFRHAAKIGDMPRVMRQVQDHLGLYEAIGRQI